MGLGIGLGFQVHPEVFNVINKGYELAFSGSSLTLKLAVTRITFAMSSAYAISLTPSGSAILRSSS